MTDPASDLPECLACGVCCFSRLDTYVRVTGDDHQRLGELAEALSCFVGNRCFMRMAEEHCAALVVEHASARFVCSVYERRPATCRDLQRGSPECLGERALKGDRPAAALR
jgi:Fe-S-cluster containining protein